MLTENFESRRKFLRKIFHKKLNFSSEQIENIKLFIIKIFCISQNFSVVSSKCFFWRLRRLKIAVLRLFLLNGCFGIFWKFSHFYAQIFRKIQKISPAAPSTRDVDSLNFCSSTSTSTTFASTSTSSTYRVRVRVRSKFCQIFSLYLSFTHQISSNNLSLYSKMLF